MEGKEMIENRKSGVIGLGPSWGISVGATPWWGAGLEKKPELWPQRFDLEGIWGGKRIS